MLNRYFALAIFFCLFAGAALAGEFSVRTLGASLSWKPTQCAMPPRVFFHVTDIDSYNAAVEEYNQYLLSVRTYRSCINEEAQKDAETAARSISSGLDQANEQINQGLNSARSELESAKRLL